MKAALLQMTSGIDPAANADTIVDAIGVAKAGGAAMLFTPEMSGLIDQDRARARDNIFAADADPVVAAARDSAAKHGIWVHLGSTPVLAGDGRFANRAFVIDAAGAIRATYDKLHLFDVDLPTGERWRESAAYAPGERAVTVETPLGVLGLAICYDLRFPALYQALTGAGATLIAIPAAFTVPTGKAHWHVLQRARAIESAAYVISAAQTGTHEDGRATYGHSLVIDPWGEVVLDMGDVPGVGFAEIDAARVVDARARVPVIDHRRTIPLVVRA